MRSTLGRPVRRLLRRTLTPAILLCVIAYTPAFPQVAQQHWFPKAHQVTGDWGGARPYLENKGVRFSLFYIQYYGHKNNGGFDTASRGRHSGSVDLFGQFDFGKMGMIPGGEALIHLKNNWGGNINTGVGSLGDPIDDADGYHAIYIDQLWYQQSSPSRKLQVRLGYLDQQTILDRNAFANSEDRQFMSTYLDNNNAIIPLAIGPGAAVFFNPTDWLSFVVTASDAEARPPHFSFTTAFDGDLDYFTYFETDLRARLSSRNGPLVGNYRFGFFLNPRNRTAFGEDRIDKSNEGFYVSFDQMLYAEPSGDEQGAGVFFRYGRRPGEVNRIAHFWSVGAEYRGLLPRTPSHSIGIGMYSAIGSTPYRVHVDPDFDRETAYELYYAARLTPAFVLTPGIQYVKQPGALKTRENVFVFALRARIRF